MDTCYLCGKQIDEAATRSMDHVPPANFYPAEARKRDRAKNLWTLPTHKGCNKSYQRDEEYFVHTFAPLVQDTPAGAALWQDVSRSIRRPEALGLGFRILREFREVTDAGLVLPGDRILKYWDGTRVRRVVWKITRGLFLKDHGVLLPERIAHRIEVMEMGKEPPRGLLLLQSFPTLGQFPGVFDYRRATFDRPKKFHYWGMLFWSKILSLITLHDADCGCSSCGSPGQDEGRARAS